MSEISRERVPVPDAGGFIDSYLRLVLGWQLVISLEWGLPESHRRIKRQINV
jgi:hypothetical protein